MDALEIWDYGTLDRSANLRANYCPAVFEGTAFPPSAMMLGSIALSVAAPSSTIS